MSRSGSRVAAIVVFLFAPWAGLAFGADAMPALPANLSVPAKTTPMPEFSFADLRGGTLQSSDMKGKVVIIRFWATW